MKIVDGKLKEISRKEYDDIKYIALMKTCIKDGETIVREYLGLEDKWPNNEIAYNVLMAVEHDYKYFKITD